MMYVIMQYNLNDNREKCKITCESPFWSFILEKMIYEKEREEKSEDWKRGRRGQGG